MNSRQRYNMKRMSEYNAKKSEVKAYSRRIDRAFSRLSEGCSDRAVKATSLPPVQVKDTDQTACCIPQVALYCAGHRTVKDVWQTGSLSVRGRQKVKGKSIPLI